jgi:uncharacterized protein (DUF2235 family)
MKRIAIFCDGTWNTPDEQENGKPCQTNVVKLANALKTKSADGTVQKLYYDLGIGAEGNKLKKIFDGATGTGISENILQAYQFIMNNYEPDDELFLFGFSRGAFTVRSLSGLIRNSGILDVKNASKTGKAFELYRSRHPAYHPKSEEATLFRKTYAVEESTNIKFIGVWDTVGALGNPLVAHSIFNGRSEFHDTELSSKVENAFHALAIDEKRKKFEATLWRRQPNVKNQTLEQMWFVGVHSDVGGGYPDSALSDISLQWMLEKADSCHLSFHPVDLHPDPMGLKHESMKWYYRINGVLHRPIGKPLPGEAATNEYLHPSVMERYNNDPSYRPENLKRFLEQPA